MKLTPGVNFHFADAKSAKKTAKLSIFFALLGSARTKAAHRMLMKLTLVFNFILRVTSSFCADILLRKNYEAQL
jgi:hypothetical protein